MFRNSAVIVTLFLFVACRFPKNDDAGTPYAVSGIYPHHYNDEGECGTGAVVPWADRLWVIMYGPYLPDGSSDKLYEITPGLKSTVREESIGGTPASRMMHRESNQLFIGPYAIDGKGTSRDSARLYLNIRLESRDVTPSGCRETVL